MRRSYLRKIDAEQWATEMRAKGWTCAIQPEDGRWVVYATRI
jgi:hypothetical protein